MEEILKRKRRRKTALIILAIVIAAATIWGLFADRGNDEGKPIAISMEIACGDEKILPMGEYECREGDTAYDVLSSICMEKNIHMEASKTPGMDSYYVEGIDHIYEFDEGSDSGWIFMVNGIRPDHGCSEVELKDGDEVLWEYEAGGLDK